MTLQLFHSEFLIYEENLIFFFISVFSTYLSLSLSVRRERCFIGSRSNNKSDHGVVGRDWKGSDTVNGGGLEEGEFEGILLSFSVT